MSDENSSYEEEEEARFYPAPGENEDDGWEFDGLDWVQYDSEDTPWVYDGEEWAVKDSDGNIFVQREDGLFLKEGDELFIQNDQGEWVPHEEANGLFDDMGGNEQLATQTAEPRESRRPLPTWAAKWTQMAALALMDSKSVRFLNLSDILGPAPGSIDVMPHGGSLFRGNAPTATEYYRTFTSFAGVGPALGDVIRQLQYICRALLRLAPRGVAKPADRLVYGVAASVLDLFDCTTAETGQDFGIIKPAIAALLKNQGGELHEPMRKRAISLLKCRLDSLAAHIAMIAAEGACPSSTDRVLYRMSLSLRALIHSVSRSLAVLDT